MNQIIIDRAKCVKCGLCVKDCIVEVLKFSADGYPVLGPEDEPHCLNCQHCLAVCPKGAVTCNHVSAEDCAMPGPLPAPENMLNLLCQRRSIRQFKPEPVSGEVMKKLKDVLAWMPTGCNDHRLYFLIGQEPEFMKQIREITASALRFLIRTGIMRIVYPNYKRYLSEIMNGKDVVFRNAPHVIIAATPKNAPCKEADPWIALSYFDLYAHTFGLGTCWDGFAVYAFKFIPKLRKLIQLPKGYRIGAVMIFGYPAVQYPRTTAPKQFRISQR